MFKVILSAIVALGFSAAFAQEGAAPSKMDSAPAAAAPTDAAAPAADKPAKKAKHKHGKKKKDAEEAPKAE